MLEIFLEKFLSTRSKKTFSREVLGVVICRNQLVMCKKAFMTPANIFFKKLFACNVNVYTFAIRF